jgi:NitT/TauT family transport system substrate-binding protein
MKETKPRILCLASFIIIFSMVFVLMGCTKTATEEKKTLVKTKKDTFVVAIPTYPGFAIPFIAEKMGFFKDQKVVLKRIDDPAVINSGIIKGEIDASFTSTDSFVLAASQGVNAKAVLLTDESHGADGIIVKKKIASINDLKGKKVALNIGWPGHFFLLYNLDKAGMSPSDVTIINMDADKAGAAFVSGKLDAAVTWEPWLSKAKESPVGKVLVSTKDIRGIIIDPLIVSSDTIKKYPGSVQAFVKGYFDAFNWYLNNKAEGNKIMADAFGLKGEEFEAMISNSMLLGPAENKQMLQTGGDIEKLFNKAADLWLAAKVIDKKPAVEKTVTAEFIP